VVNGSNCPGDPPDPEDGSDSAVEAICVSPSGASVLQNVRQLTAMALNCCISGFSEFDTCGGDAGLLELFNDCNNACRGLSSTRDNTRCRDEIDCFNNGGHYISGSCVFDSNNCHERAEALFGICSNGTICTDGTCANGSVCKPGPAGSSNACNGAISNRCTVIGDPSGCQNSNTNGPDPCGD
jgi:hypothetical protein